MEVIVMWLLVRWFLVRCLVLCLVRRKIFNRFLYCLIGMMSVLMFFFLRLIFWLLREWRSKLR